MTGFEEVAVVTCFLRHDADVLLFRRSEEVGSYAGRWGTVAGHAEGDPDAATCEEIREETGLDPETDVTLVRAGEQFAVEDADRGTRWVVHPFLFDAHTRDITTNYETTEHEWVPPTEIRRRDTVPDLWKSYDRVRPRVETVVQDRDHGSTYLSARALEVLRDEAAIAATRDETGGGGDGSNDQGWQDLRVTAERLRDARPAMPVVTNRIDRAMDAASDEETPAALEAAAKEELDRALAADDEAATLAAERIRNLATPVTVATLSRSGTVRTALEAADPDRVVIAESRPGREGIATAEALATVTGVTVTTDAAFPGQVAEADALLVGADAVLPDSRVVNKVGTRAAAAVAAHQDVPCFAVAASDKIATDAEFDAEPRDPKEVYDTDAGTDADADDETDAGTDADADADADITVANPTFEATPADLFDAVLTERGPLDTADIRDIAAAHRERADW